MSWTGRNIAEWCDEHRCDQAECHIIHLEAEHDRLKEIERLAGELADHIIESGMSGKLTTDKARQLEAKINEGQVK